MFSQAVFVSCFITNITYPEKPTKRSVLPVHQRKHLGNIVSLLLFKIIIARLTFPQTFKTF